MSIDEAGLTAKQRIFVDEYVQCWNATEAARRAGYSPRTVGFTGHANLKNPKIAEEIRKTLDRSGVTATEAMRLLGEQATADMGLFLAVDDSGRIAPDLRRAKEQNKLHLIKKISFFRNGEVQAIELHDSQNALQILLKEFRLDTGQPTERVEIDDARAEIERRLARIATNRPTAAISQ